MKLTRKIFKRDLKPLIIIIILFMISFSFFSVISKRTFAIANCTGVNVGVCSGDSAWNTGTYPPDPDYRAFLLIISPFNWLNLYQDFSRATEEIPCFVSNPLGVGDDFKCNIDIINSTYLQFEEDVIQGIPIYGYDGLLSDYSNGLLCLEEGQYIFGFYVGADYRGQSIYTTLLRDYADKIVNDSGYNINAQQSQDLCECISKKNDNNFLVDTSYNWDSAQNSAFEFSCCGPTEQGAGLGVESNCQINPQSSIVCAEHTLRGNFEWGIASDEEGCSYKTSCFNNAWITSDGNQWLKCSATDNPNNENLLTTEIVSARNLGTENRYSELGCFNKNTNPSEYSIYRCIPNPGMLYDYILSEFSKCKPQDDSVLLAPGSENFSVQTNNSYVYCLWNGSLEQDLDKADNVRYETCLADGFSWTGSKCCEDPDDSNEYYNDNGALIGFDNLYDKGGCFDSRYVSSGQTLYAHPDIGGVFDTKKIINYHGTFYGCNITQVDSDLLTPKDSYTGSSLIDTFVDSEGTNIPVCTALANATRSQNFYCSENNIWEETSSERMHISSILPHLDTSSLLKEACCDYSACWNGTTCVNSLEHYSRQGIYKNPRDLQQQGYICLQPEGIGTWKAFTGFKKTWDNRASFLCSSDSQCLVNENGNPAADNQPENYPENNLMCIDNGQYIDDYYCNKGNWTTRSKLIAETLIDSVSGDYTLYCDNSSLSLNNLNYAVKTSTNTDELVSNILNDANNFCVLTNNGNIVFGTSLNKGIGQIEFLSIFGADMTYCDNSQTNSYVTCSNGNGNGWNIFYNQNLRSVILTKNPSFTISNNPISFEERFNTYDLVMNAKSLSQNTIPYLNLSNLFGQVYVLRKGTKSAVGFRDSKFFGPGLLNYYLVNYQMSNVNVCSYVHDYVLSQNNCNFQGNTYYVYGQNLNNDFDIKMMGAWRDATAKMRPK